MNKGIIHNVCAKKSRKFEADPIIERECKKGWSGVEQRRYSLNRLVLVLSGFVAIFVTSN